MSNLSKDNIKLLNLTLPFIPAYGEFYLGNIIPQIPSSNYNFIAQVYSGNNEDIISEFLARDGFAVRHIPTRIDVVGWNLPPMTPSLELTDKGRKLKELGSLKSYRSWQKRQYKKRVSLVNVIGVFLAIIGILATIYPKEIRECTDHLLRVFIR